MKKGALNTITSLLSQLVTIALGIVIPRLILINLGSEANGLMSSVGTALSYLVILESGIGMTTLQALYRPVAENDRSSVNAILSATNHYYRRIGKIYSLVVVVIAAVYTVTVKTTIPRTIVLAVILLSGGSGVLGYFFSSKLTLFLQAEGKSYIQTILTTAFSTLTSVSKILLIVWGGGILQLQILYFVISALQTAAICLFMRKNYPWISCRERPDLEALSQHRAGMVHNISGLIFSGTDVLLLTYICNLSVVSVYNMYAMIYGMMKAVAVSFSDGFLYALGQSYHQKERFRRLFDTYEVFNMALTFAVFCAGYILMIPFMKLYTAGVSDINYIDPKVSLLFVCYYILHNGRKSSGTVINIAGKFEETKLRSVLESAINIVSSVALTFRFGIYGVLLGTILALLYRTTDMIIFAARLMERSPWVTGLRWLRNVAVFVGVVFLAGLYTPDLSSYWNMIPYGIVLTVITLAIFLGINSLFEPEVAKHLMQYLRDKLSARRSAKA